MDKQLEERIRERAYELWMRHGSLPGRADEYWYQAEQEILGHAETTEGSQEDSQEDSPPLPIMDPAPLGMTSMTADEILSSPAAPAPKTRKKRSPATAPAAEVADAPAPAEAPKRKRATRVT
jgi:hypothetical protein